jgi:hypothetical protein
MPESTFIVVRWMWYFYPSVWLGWAVRHLMEWCLVVLEDEDHRAWLDRNTANAAWFGGWIALAETRLDELIAMKAMKGLRRHWVGRRKLSHVPARSVRTAAEAANRLTRLILRYHDAQRLIVRRARLLRRLISEAELRFEITHHPVDTQPASAGGAGAGGAGVSENVCGGVAACANQRIRAPP